MVDDYVAAQNGIIWTVLVKSRVFGDLGVLLNLKFSVSLSILGSKHIYRIFCVIKREFVNCAFDTKLYEFL